MAGEIPFAFLGRDITNERIERALHMEHVVRQTPVEIEGQPQNLPPSIADDAAMVQKRFLAVIETVRGEEADSDSDAIVSEHEDFSGHHEDDLVTRGEATPTPTKCHWIDGHCVFGDPNKVKIIDDVVYDVVSPKLPTDPEVLKAMFPHYHVPHQHHSIFEAVAHMVHNIEIAEAKTELPPKIPKQEKVKSLCCCWK